MLKIQTVLAFLLIGLPAFLVAQDSRFSVEPKYPQQGEKITISFNPAGTELEGAKTIGAVIYWFDKNSMRSYELPMTKSGSAFTGSYNLDKTAAVAALYFIAGNIKENNQKKGYVIPVYDDKKQLVQYANRALYKLYGEWDGEAVGIERDPELGQVYMEKEYHTYPGNRLENFYDYFNSLRFAKKENIKDIIIAEGAKVEAAGNLSESNLYNLSTYYDIAKQKEKAAAITAKIKEQFPNGDWKKHDAYQAINAEKDAAKREVLVQGYLKEINFNPEQAAGVKWRVASVYAAEKNWDKFNAWVKDIDMGTLSGNYNNLAWNWAKKDENLEMAKKLSYQATAFAKKDIGKPTGEKPVAITTQEWEDNRKVTYSMYADTYAYVLFKLKDYKTGYAYAKEAVEIQKRKDADYNERYSLLLEKVATPAQVKKELEVLVKEGAAGHETREVLQRNYIALNKSGKGFDAYMAGLDAAPLEKLRETLKKQMFSKEAPAFRLLNLQGTEVDFASLKGKVVILDFWATWCGPCVASFPSMQKLVEKYKNNKDVVFLFIDTWENVPDREKLVQQFIDKNKYTFNVLYDKLKVPGSNDFTMVKDYDVEAIPTKFVVDGNGQIRFKSTGWSGNDFSFMQELQLMIDMAGQGSGTGESNKKGFK